MRPNTKRNLTVAALSGVIAVACAWIYFAQTRSAAHNVALHRRIGEIMAEQTAALIGKKGKVVTIAIESKEWPELKTQLESFQAALKKLGSFEVRTYEMDTKDQPKYGVGSGLSWRRYVRTVKKNEEADVFVSFVGAPKITDEDVAALEKAPRFIAESRSTDNLPKLFQKKLLHVAVVSRYQFPAPGPENPVTPDEWFNKRYQIVKAEGVANLQATE
ncbi:MAG TPA: hypothetical protein VK327_13060 [Candidatus Paceibacterota bacterium]|nr:hypothetical protein [Candidatus Paceibacterota bacterium]